MAVRAGPLESALFSTKKRGVVLTSGNPAAEDRGEPLRRRYHTGHAWRAGGTINANQTRRIFPRTPVSRPERHLLGGDFVMANRASALDPAVVVPHALVNLAVLEGNKEDELRLPRGRRAVARRVDPRDEEPGTTRSRRRNYHPLKFGMHYPCGWNQHRGPSS